MALDEQTLKTIWSTASFSDVRQIGLNARRLGKFDVELEQALDARASELGRIYLGERTGIDLTNLTPAEEKIVQAVSTYVGMKVRDKSNANRTIEQLKNRGLIGAAEIAVSKSKPTIGYERLADEGRQDLSYEQIIVEHPEEFTARALWYARNTLGLSNEATRPARSVANKPVAESTEPESDGPYWVFVCNPAKWAVDRFLASGQERDTWGVRPSDRARFAPGQLGLVRVGVDQRSALTRDGRPALDAGVYALCEVESGAFDGTGASDTYWTAAAARAPGWPTVRIRYLRNWLHNPITIDRLREQSPDLSPLFLNGFQAASFPISGEDFRRILEVAGETSDNLSAPVPGDLAPDKIAEAEERYRHASPEIKERLSRTIERGNVGALVKRAVGYSCQVCGGLGLPALGFEKKRDGKPYVEAHHVMPVHRREVGSLAASNILVLCATHHRQVHYGRVEVAIRDNDFEIEIEGLTLTVPRPAMGKGSA